MPQVMHAAGPAGSESENRHHDRVRCLTRDPRSVSSRARCRSVPIDRQPSGVVMTETPQTSDGRAGFSAFLGPYLSGRGLGVMTRGVEGSTPSRPTMPLAARESGRGGANARVAQQQSALAAARCAEEAAGAAPASRSGETPPGLGQRPRRPTCGRRRASARRRARQCTSGPTGRASGVMPPKAAGSNPARCAK